MNLIYLESVPILSKKLTHYMSCNVLDFFEKSSSYFLLTERSSEDEFRNINKFLELYNDSSSNETINMSPILNSNYSREEFMKLKSSFINCKT